MQKIYSLLLLASLLAAPTFAQFPNIFFNAVLSGSEQVPAVQTNGSGMISLLFNHERTKIKISGLLTNLDGSVTAANLHLGRRGENGAAVLDLKPLIIGRKIEGEINAPAGLLPQLVGDQIYFNVRTTAHPDGELRGQLRCESDLNFSIEFSAKNMVPAVSSPAAGLGVIHFPVGSSEVISVFGMRGMNGPITAATIFRGKPGEAGVKIADFLVNPPGEIIATTTGFDDLEPNFIENCQRGEYFVVLKSAQFPNGEARGQVKTMGYINSIFTANSFNNVPPTTSQAFGFGYAELTPGLDSLQTLVVVNGIQPTAASIRKGQPTEIGPLFVSQTPDPTAVGFFRTKFKLAPADLTDFVEGKFYLDFASASYPNGEIRSQMKNSLRHCFAFDLCGKQVVPPTASTALGMGMLSVDQIFCYINYKVASDGLSGQPTAVGLFNAQRGSNGSKMYDLAKKSPLLEGIRAIVVPNGEKIEKLETYISLATAAFPDGEIRGQVVRELTCPLISAVPNGEFLTVAEIFPNPFDGQFFVKISTENPTSARLVLRDLLGRILWGKVVWLDSTEQVFSFSEKNLPAGLLQISVENLSDGRVLWRRAVVKN